MHRLETRRTLGHALFCAAVLLAALSACAPRADGECASTSACRRGLTCQAGLCLTERACPAGCGAQFHCDDGSCLEDFAPTIAITSPSAGTWFGRSAMNVAVTATAPGGVHGVTVEAIGPAGASLTAAATGDAATHLYAAAFDVSVPAFTDGAWRLVAHVAYAGGDAVSAPLAVNVDKTGPQISLQPLDYGGGKAFIRDGTVRLSAVVTDAGRGVDPASVAVQAAGMKDQPGALSGGAFAFSFSARLPTFESGAGDVPITVVAKDYLGNTSIASGTFSMTRLKWVSDGGRGLAIESSPAVDGQKVYVGDDAGMLSAIDRASGQRVWEHNVGSAIVASPVLGSAFVYAATQGGGIAAFHADGGAAWSCPGLAGTFSFSSSPALGQTDGEETLFVVNDSIVALPSGKTVPGGVLAIRASGFPVDVTGTTSCYRYGAWGKGRSSPAIGGDGAIYVGSEDKSGYRLRFGPDDSGVYVFSRDWSYATGSDVTGSPAVTAAGNVVFGSEDSTIYALAANRTPVWTPFPVLTDKVLASPIAANGTTLALDRSGELLAVDSASGARRWSVSLAGGGEAASTPALGGDGVAYALVDKALFALDVQGRTLWTLEAKSSIAYSSPTLACDGALYFGDAAGRLYAIVTDSPGLAKDGWPRFRHDARNTGNAGTSLACP